MKNNIEDIAENNRSQEVASIGHDAQVELERIRMRKEQSNAVTGGFQSLLFLLAVGLFIVVGASIVRFALGLDLP